ncbi:MAG: S1C family serine protease [Nitrospinota bacterium]
MKSVRLLACLFLLASFSVPAHSAQSVGERLKAIVKTRARIPRNARTARSLGRLREGNGVVIDSRGHVLTIGYLILEADFIEIRLSEGKWMKAAFVAYDHRTGFGLVRAAGPLGVIPMRFGNSGALKKGAPALVASHGGENSLMGVRIISRKEFAGYWKYLLDKAIFTSPPHPEFAGAALIRPGGRLLAIGSLFSRTVLPGVGIVPGNMFVPIDLLKPILADLKKSGRSSKPPRPWMGLFAAEVRDRLFVNRISPGGPAERAGVRPGDIILAVNQEEVKTLAGFYRKVWALGGAGVEVPIRVLQGSRIENITIRSSERFRYLKLR